MEEWCESEYLVLSLGRDVSKRFRPKERFSDFTFRVVFVKMIFIIFMEKIIIITRPENEGARFWGVRCEAPHTPKNGIPPQDSDESLCGDRFFAPGSFWANWSGRWIRTGKCCGQIQQSSPM